MKYALDDVLNIDLPVVLMLENKSITTIAERALSLSRQHGYLAQITSSKQELEVRRIGEMPLSLGQQAIWTVCQVESAGVIYNLPIVIRVHSEIDTVALRSALKELLVRHEQLRAGFRLNEAMQPVQTIHPAMEPCFEHVFCDPDSDVQRQISAAIRLPFNLETGLCSEQCCSVRQGMIIICFFAPIT